jgi:hypothetical protein
LVLADDAKADFRPNKRSIYSSLVVGSSSSSLLPQFLFFSPLVGFLRVFFFFYFFDFLSARVCVFFKVGESSRKLLSEPIETDQMVLISACFHFNFR